MDIWGKDGIIRHVFYCINPQGCIVKSFKTATEEEKLHDFLWRIYVNLPEQGMIQIFNLSHYEDILFPVVHGLIDKKQISKRHKMVNQFQEHLQKDGTIILKFFLHISKKEQDGRLEKRLTNPEKKWKYNAGDKKEAKKWDDYMDAYQNVLNGCEKHNPSIVVPADNKWYRNYLVANIIVETLENLKMNIPNNFLNIKIFQTLRTSLSIKFRVPAISHLPMRHRKRNTKSVRCCLACGSFIILKEMKYIPCIFMASIFRF